MRHAEPVRLETAFTVLPFGRYCFHRCLYGAVRNRTYRVGVNAVRLETHLPGLVFTINCPDCVERASSVFNNLAAGNEKPSLPHRSSAVAGQDAPPL